MMKTFKFCFVALAATVLFYACSNEEAIRPINDEAQAISFRLQGGTPEITTRATATTAPYVDAFVVYGIDDVATTNLFNGETVARQVSGNFDYNPKRYYNGGATSAGFIAYSPASANITTSSVPDPLTSTASFTYTVKAPDGTATGETIQEDFLIANTTVTPSSSAVSLAFQHALSRIFVKATNAMKETVVITGLQLLNLKETGTVTATPTTWSWTGQTGTADYVYKIADAGVAVIAELTTATLVTSIEQGMMVLPQTIVNASNDHTLGDFALEVTYDVANLTGQKAYVYITAGSTFVAGSQYAITINFSGSDLIKIDFTISVTPFGSTIINAL